MPDYKKGCIYMIKSKDENIKKIYIGSTCNFSRRKKQHKTNCNNQNGLYYNLNVYKFIRANNGWNDWDMIKIKDYPCNIKSELEAEERKIITSNYGYDNCLNIQVPTRTIKEYYNDNKELISEQKKQYYKDNKAKRLEYQNKYRSLNLNKLHQKFSCECKGKYILANRSIHLKTKKHKKYLEPNSP